MAIPTVDEIEKMAAQRGVWSYIKNIRSDQPTSIIFRMRVSPEGNFLACLHSCGLISVWTLPGLRMHKMWTLEEQPANCLPRNPVDKKYLKEVNVEDVPPIDLSWWPEEKLIIAWRNGAVGVCELNTLHNLLGDNLEFLCGEPALSSVCTDRGFLALECDVQILSNKRKTPQLQDQEDSQQIVSAQYSLSDQDSGDEEGTYLLRHGTELIQSIVYFFTDIEQFRPKRKRPKVVQRTYRLLGVKSTTPEELFTRRIDNEEYGEALALAQTYGLDSDRVYQRQWRNNPVSVATIHEYLSKVSKYQWVLQECCDRVPETLSAAQELIEFGLKMTETQLKTQLLNQDDAEDIYESTEDVEKDRHIPWKDKLDSLKTENLAEDLKRLIVIRLKLLQYSDRLHTYQLILGCDSSEADTNFDSEFYNKFRQQDIVNSAIGYARQGNFKAVEYLLTYHGSETVKCWLKILENFPETLLPSNYSYLLPECSSEGDVFEWNTKKIREDDWCEADNFQYLMDEDDNSLRESDLSERSQSEAYDKLTPSLLTDWYISRVYQLERCSHLVDPPLDLIRLARERNIMGLDELHHQLLTLDMLVYELAMEDMDLETLEKKTPLEKAILLLTNSVEDTFVGDLLHRVVPYLNRCETLNSGSKKTLLVQLLKSFSGKSLTLPLKLFMFFQEEPVNVIISTVEDRVILTLESLYANGETEDLDKAFQILGFLPDRISMRSSKELEDLCERLDCLEAELEAAVLLKKHGQLRSALYIHNSAKDVDTVQKLVLRIARTTAHKVPPASENEWAELLADILKLHTLVFTCLPLELCYELYVSTVLASGNSKVIRSAMKILSCCVEDKKRKPLTFERSVFLVLQAAREYFDSAGSLTDPGIQNSKTCLNLIIEENEEIAEELDLLQSLQILNEFGVNLLPMQVRLCPDRMRLVETCLQGRTTAYQNEQKLLTLAEKLRVCGKDSQLRRGKVLVLVAEAAFTVRDYNFCSGVCKILIKEEYSGGWIICQRMAQCSNYKELQLRKKFIAFAILHCPVNNIQEFIEIRCDLEKEILQNEISKKVSTLGAYTSSFEQEDEFVDALTSPSTPSKEFLPQLATKFHSTTKFLSRVAGTDFWKNSLNLNFSEGDRDRAVIAFDNSGLKKQGFSEFYSSLHPQSYHSTTSLKLDNSNNINEKRLEQYRFVYVLLQSALLEEEKEFSKSSAVAINSVLIQCSQLIMSEDCVLGLSFLFALTNETLAEQCFSVLPQSLVCLQLALYFYSLVNIAKNQSDVFYMFPHDVVTLALQEPPQSEYVYKLIQKYKAKIENYMQAQKMKELDCGVNIDRFTEDSEYKQDSILGLAMCQEWEKVELALELGQIHGVNGYEVAISHIVSLFLNGNHQLAIEHIADNKLASLLLDQPQLVQERLANTVFPNINGTNHQLMIAYYTVLQCVSGNSVVDGLLPKDHIKLIKKVKATSSAIDYKGLLHEPLLNALRPALNKESAASVARLLKTLPQHIRGSTTISHLYLDLLNTDFFYQCLGFSSENESVHQFELLKTFFSKVTPEDLVQFVKTCIFSRSCAQQLKPSTRSDMVNEVVDFCLQHKNSEPYGEAALLMKQWSDHISNVWTSDDQQMNNFIKKFFIELDISCGDVESIKSVIERALPDSTVPFPLIESKTPLAVHIPSIISKLLQSQISADAIDVLLSRIESCLQKGMKDPEWNVLLQGYTANSELSSKSRLLIVSLLQKLNEQQSAEGNIQLITEAVLGKHVSENEVMSEQGRLSLFTKLLNEFNSWDELCTLKQLLSCWPSFSVTEYSCRPSLQLILKVANFNSDEVLPFTSEIIKENTISEEELCWLVYELENKVNSILVIWLCLSSVNTELHLKGLQILEVIDIEIIPEKIVKKFIELQYVPNIIESSIYSLFIESLILLNDNNLINKTVQQLIDSEHMYEAGHLILMSTGVPASLRTFSSALSVVTNFMSSFT